MDDTTGCALVMNLGNCVSNNPVWLADVFILLNSIKHPCLMTNILQYISTKWVLKYLCLRTSSRILSCRECKIQFKQTRCLLVASHQKKI